MISSEKGSAGPAASAARLTIGRHWAKAFVAMVALYESGR